ncbi:hypothetical protein EVAR_96501_1 [Eumeta japonica]|uniref:Uncharacterized protein n=1 Tax=Eumeta variegata TaxID=151549 RepID=A0A4C1ZQY6_EUMVA|nr:hypothetical protein EVAR_96501_1 [Eumeta japonica]
MEEHPVRLPPCELAGRESAVRAEGGVSTVPLRCEASALRTSHDLPSMYVLQEYDETLKMDIKSECDVEDSAIIQVLATSHSHVLKVQCLAPPCRSKRRIQTHVLATVSDGAASTPPCTFLIHSVLQNEDEDQDCKEVLGVPPNTSSLIDSRHLRPNTKKYTIAKKI